MDSMALLVVGFALLAVVVWLKANHLWSQTGLPDGQIAYDDVIHSDDGDWYRQREPLYSQSLQLVGRPDYLVEERNGQVIPVEVKSAAAPQHPYQGHLMQLAAYCILVQENYGQRPAYGILQYRDRAFAVDFTPDLEEAFYQTLDEMRQDLNAVDLNRDHNDWRRCGRCSLRGQCAQRLG